MTVAEPVADQATVMEARTLLDDALVGLTEVRDPELPVREAVLHTALALENVYGALARRTDFAAFSRGVGEAAESTRLALGALQAVASDDPAAGSTLALLARALRTLTALVAPPANLPLSLPDPTDRTPPLPASRDEPAPLRLPRAVLHPAILLPVQEETPAITVDIAPPGGSPVVAVNLDALLAQAAAGGEAADADPPEDEPARPEATTEPKNAPVPDGDSEHESLDAALSKDAVLAIRARDFFEELAMMGLMRKADPGDAWRNLRLVEQRLLARVDAIVACGERFLPALVAHLESRPVPDPELTWASLFVYGMIAGDDALDQVMRLVRSLPLDDAAMFEAVADALSFVPQSGLDERLRPWLAAAAAPASGLERRLALRVLGRRGTVDVASALRAAAAGNERDVRREGARALGRAVGSLDGQVLRPLMEDPDGEIAGAAMDAAGLHGLRSGVRWARELLSRGRPDHGDAAMYVALGGEAQERGALAALTAPRDAAKPGAPATGAIEAMGWFGDLTFVPYLLDALAAKELAAPAAAALFRLTGAALEEDTPDPDYPPERRPFAARVRPPPVVGLLSVDPLRWRAWWKRHGHAANPNIRHRWGGPWDLADNLWEMAEAPASTRDRTWAHRELVARTGKALPFHPEAFVARQERQLGEWRAVVQRAGDREEGRWPVHAPRG
jgi:hypothetical protein